MSHLIRLMPRWMKFVCFRIFPLPFVIAGGLVLYIGLVGLFRASASADWPTVDGTIVSSSVDRRSSTGSNTSPSTGSRTTYRAKIRYEFSVDGATHSNTRVAFGDFGNTDASHAHTIVRRYPEGKPVTVHYMPANPETSVLEPGIKAQAWILLGVGLLFFGLGILMLIFLPKLFARGGQAE